VSGHVVGVVTTSYPRFTGDPAGSFVAGHVAALRALGYEVDVVAAGDATPDAPDPTAHRIGGSRLFYQGGAPDQLEATPVRSLVDAAAFTARLTAAVTRRAKPWDSIVAHWLAPSAIAALPANKPLLAIAHGGDVHALRARGLLGPVLRLLRARGARIVFVSSQLRELARREVPTLEAEVQPMGLDVARFAAIPRAPTAIPTVLVVARLVPIKGVDVAITAFAHVTTRARLVIAGDGPNRTLLRRAPNVELVGEVDATERDRWLGRASVVVVPSRILKNGRTEGAPLIALEALAAGVPVVASAVGGLVELPVTHVPPEDPRALAAAIDHALATPAAAAALRASVAAFDWGVIAPRLVRTD
jgi:glycosyltransferase involved in cell wall biosynthesis